MDPREKYRIDNKDMYLLNDVICPNCKKSFQKSMSFDCPSCNIKIFEKDKEGWAVLVEPEKADRSRKYTVKGLFNVETGERETKYYPGDVVMLNIPFVTDCSTYVYVNDEYTNAAGFIMPEHDVEVDVKRVNNMMNTSGNTGFMGMGMMNMNDTMGMNMMNMMNMNGTMGMMNGSVDINSLADNNVSKVSDEPLDPDSTKECPMCKALANKNAKFCPECGAKL